MARVWALVERVAPVSVAVLITGETGTGKELVAQAVHQRSPRRARPYLVQNCAALSESLLDDELFGHARGAFTGATGERAGLLEACHGGTIFLDEVGEMTPAMQAKLLRVLQNGEVRRIGENTTRRVSVRVICATHRDLSELVRTNEFRADPHHRLRAFHIHLPPLRARREEIAGLVHHFVALNRERHGRQNAGLSEAVLRRLEAHPWPGNVRELEHVVERLVLLTREGSPIEAATVDEALGSIPSEDGLVEALAHGLDAAVARYERRLIEATLAQHNGNIADAARALQVERSTLSKRMKRHGLRA